MGDIQPDALGFAASLETTNEPLEMCYSCQRALLYGAMVYAGAVAAELERLGRAASAANKHIDTLITILAEFAKVDFIGSWNSMGDENFVVPEATDLSQEDWAIAIESFHKARVEKYVGDDGRINRDPHNDDGEPDVFADPDGGVTV